MMKNNNILFVLAGLFLFLFALTESRYPRLEAEYDFFPDKDGDEYPDLIRFDDFSIKTVQSMLDSMPEERRFTFLHADDAQPTCYLCSNSDRPYVLGCEHDYKQEFNPEAGQNLHTHVLVRLPE